MKAALAALAAALALAACAPLDAIKAYEGPERSAEEVATLETEFRDDTFSVSENLIGAVDGVRYDKRRYSARVLPGAHWIGIVSALRVSRQSREQFCAFELNAEAGCTYRPALPPYPRAALDEPADRDWHVARSMTVLAECADTSYAMQVSVECAARPLCPAAQPAKETGFRFASCP